jgi:signal transduction histidine kinase
MCQSKIVINVAISCSPTYNGGMRPRKLPTKPWAEHQALPNVWRNLSALMMSGKGVLSVDGLDALVRGLAMTMVVLLSLLGYEHSTGEPGAGRVLEPLVVAACLVAYNGLVILLLGVPWRHRPGFYLYLFDWAVASASIALTGWLFSPFIVLLYALVIGAALRLGFSRYMSIVCACAVIFLSLGAIVPASMESLKLPVLVVEATSLVMVAVTAAAMRCAVEVELRHVELEEQSVQQFRLLNELINSLLSGTPDLDRVTRSVAAVSSAALRADAGLVVMPEGENEQTNEDGGSLTPAQFYLASDSDPNPILLSPSERELIGQVFSSAAPQVVHEAPSPAEIHFPALARNGVPPRTVLCVPFSLDENSTGALLVGRHSAQHFSEADVNLLAAIGQQMAVAVRLARLYAMEHDRATQSAERERLERDLLSIVSHDLRTPLTAIKMCVGALSKGAEDPTQERLVRNIERNTDRLAGLVDDLLDMARLRSERITLNFQRVNIGETISELAAQVWPMIESKGQALQVDLPAHGSLRWNNLTVPADRGRIEQVLLNLIANAHKYAPEDSTITLGATPRGSEIRVFVRDEGPGIAPRERRRIFDKFYTGPISDQREASQSVGLGLAIARSLVAMHGGEIGVQSRVGGGSTFYFTLPRNDSYESSKFKVQSSNVSTANLEL